MKCLPVIDKIKVLPNFIQLRFDLFPIEDVFVLFEPNKTVPRIKARMGLFRQKCIGLSFDDCWASRSIELKKEQFLTALF